ncbi:MAG: hypothetical protein AAFY71_00210 [Bacteroidota bacterium]
MTSLFTIVILFVIWQLFVGTAPPKEEPKVSKLCQRCGYRLPPGEKSCEGNCEILEFSIRHKKGGEEY